MKELKIWVDHLYDNDHLTSGQMLVLKPKFDNVITMASADVTVGRIAMLLVGLQFWEEQVFHQKTNQDLTVDVDDQTKRLVKMVSGLHMDIWKGQLSDQQPDIDWVNSMFDYEQDYGCGFDQAKDLGFIDLYRAREAWTGPQWTLLIDNVQHRGNDAVDGQMADLITTAIKKQKDLDHSNDN